MIKPGNINKAAARLRRLENLYDVLNLAADELDDLVGSAPAEFIRILLTDVRDMIDDEDLADTPRPISHRVN